MGEAEVEVRAEQDQRPKRRRYNRRDDVGHVGQVAVVAVLGADDGAKYQICESGQIAHSFILRRASRRSSRIDVAKRMAVSVPKD